MLQRFLRSVQRVFREAEDHSAKKREKFEDLSKVDKVPSERETKT
jgi:hypothetical protein